MRDLVVDRDRRWQEDRRKGRRKGRRVVVWVVVLVTLLGASVGAVLPAAAASPEPPFPITSAAPASGTENIAYSHSFTAAAPGARWTVTAGTLPPGLTLDPSSGVLSGTPVQAGTWADITVAAGWPSHVSPGPYQEAGAGYRHTCGLVAADGSVRCWGSNEDGQSADQAGPFDAVAVGGYHTCALVVSNGSADCWGMNYRGQAADQVGPYTDIVAGGLHTCAIRAADGSVDCWGENTYGQSNDQTGPYVALRAGNIHNCAIRADDGSVDCWGANDAGQAGHHVGPFVAVGPGNDHTCAILAADGSVQCWGANSAGQSTPQVGPYAAITGTRGFFTCGLLDVSGAIDCWGANYDGQAEDQDGPYADVAGGADHACGLTAADSSLHCWGDNTYGQVADTESPTLSTTQTFSLTIDVGLAPSVTSMTPRAGVRHGGTTVTLTGQNFAHATAVRFGSFPTQPVSFTIVDDSTIVATSPPYVPALVNVWIDTPNGSNANLPVTHFTYQDASSAAPVVTSVSPNIGSVAGGETVTILGDNFVDASSVSFGSTAASYTIINDAKIVATAPARAEGLVNVRVTNPVGTNPNQTSSWYSYRVTTGPPPTVTSVSPDSGPTAGGTAVTITGTGFTGTIRVDFASTTAPSFVVVNDTTIVVQSPARPVGLVNIWVRTNNGANTNSSSSWYRFTS